MIPVTKSFLPPKEEYDKLLDLLWDSGWLTNRGELVIRLESELKQYLKVDQLLLLNNGTIPLQIALKLLCKKKQVITTPFSYVATIASIVWEGFEPVFVDIDEKYLTIDESKVEAAITEDTGAILATHVYGNPCNVEMLESLSRQYKIPVIYDGAHAFGVTYKGQSIFNFGTVSTCSFHATKVFHTCEGGAMICRDKELMDKIFYSHNFGHNGPLAFHGLGINGKMAEVNAAMGICNLAHFESIIDGRKYITQLYDRLLDFTKIRTIQFREDTQRNYSYYPIVFNDEASLLKVEKALNGINVFPRRYFYPSLNKLPYVNCVSMPVAEKIANSIICLPLYIGLDEAIVAQIANVVNDNTIPTVLV